MKHLCAKDLLRVNRIIQDMGLAANYESCLNSVVNKLANLFHVKRVSLMVLGQGKILRIHAAKGISPEIIKQAKVRVGQGISGKIIQTGKAVLVRDIERHKKYTKKSHSKYYTKSFLSAPLLIKGKAIGVINLNNKTDRKPFAESDLALLKPLLAHIAVVVKNALLIKELRLSNTELKTKIRMITTLFDMSQDVIRTEDIKKIFNEILQKTLHLLSGDSGSLMLYDQEKCHLAIRASVGLTQEEISYANAQEKEKSISHWVASTGEPLLLVGDLKMNSQFSKMDILHRAHSMLSVPLAVPPEKHTRLESAISVPLHVRQNVIGVINVNRSSKQHEYTQKDLEFLSVLSFQLAMAVENAELLDREKRHLSELAETKKRLEAALESIAEELEMARLIQRTMLPQTIPEYPNFKIAARYIPYGAVGGDLYDVIKIDENHLAVLVFDVAGHGLPAALVTAMAKISFTKSILSSMRPGTILAQVSSELIEVLEEHTYLTAGLLIFNRQTSELTYSMAGHPPGILLRQGTHELIPLTHGGSFIGIFPSERFEEGSVTLNPGDKVILYTDGLNEAINPDKKCYDADRLTMLLIKNESCTVDVVCDRIIEAAVECEDKTLSDDITLVVMECLPLCSQEMSPADVSSPDGGMDFPKPCLS